jgi:hypothetical protein
VYYRNRRTHYLAHHTLHNLVRQNARAGAIFSCDKLQLGVV